MKFEHWGFFFSKEEFMLISKKIKMFVCCHLSFPCLTWALAKCYNSRLLLQYCQHGIYYKTTCQYFLITTHQNIRPVLPWKLLVNWSWGSFWKEGGLRLQTLYEPQLTPLQPETSDIQSALSISGGTKVAQIPTFKELIFLRTCVILWNKVWECSDTTRNH